MQRTCSSLLRNSRRLPSYKLRGVAVALDPDFSKADMQIESLATGTDPDSRGSSKNPSVAIQVYRHDILMLHGIVFQFAGLNTMQELSLAFLYSGGMCVGEIVSEKFSQPDHITTYESFTRMCSARRNSSEAEEFGD